MNKKRTGTEKQLQFNENNLAISEIYILLKTFGS